MYSPTLHGSRPAGTGQVSDDSRLCGGPSEPSASQPGRRPTQLPHSCRCIVARQTPVNRHTHLRPGTARPGPTRLRHPAHLTPGNKAPTQIQRHSIGVDWRDILESLRSPLSDLFNREEDKRLGDFLYNTLHVELMHAIRIHVTQLMPCPMSWRFEL